MSRAILLPIFGLALTTACAGPDQAPDTLNTAFSTAATQYDVPRDLLVAVSYSLTRLDHRVGGENSYGNVGMMNLGLHDDGAGPLLDEAAEHLGLDPQTLVDDPVANIRGGAALLAGMAKTWEARTGQPIEDLSDWYPIVAEWSGAADPAIAEGFASQVFDHLEWGIVAETSEGELVMVEPQLMYWRNQRAARTGSGLVSQYIPASSANYTNASRPSDYGIDTVVIHTMQGSYSGSISWFQNSSASASAHYMVRSSDGEITQMLDEEDIGWHAGDWSTNANSIGIEHEGYIESPETWYTEAMYQSSAALVADVCDRYGIPKDRSHIIGHNEVPGCSSSGGGGSSCHTDPGSGWDWDYFISLVQGGGGGSVGGGTLAEGTISGSFEGSVEVPGWGASDACSGSVSGSATSGHLYLNASCYVEMIGKSDTFEVVWTGDEVGGNNLDGRVVVDSFSDPYAGLVNADGTIYAEMSGEKDLGGDVGIVRYQIKLKTNP